MHGKHAAPSAPVFAAGAALSAGTILAIAATAGPALASTSAPPGGGPDEVRAAAPDAVSVLDAPRVRPLVTRFTRHSAGKTYTVRSGDTLSGIAGQHCGTARKWPSLFNANKKVIGRNPDLILPGDRFTLVCDGDMKLPALAPVQAAAQTAPTSAVEARRDPFDGHHGQCGDGDGDGFDASCAAIFGAPAPAQQAPAQATAQVTGVSGGTYHGSGAMQQCIISRESGGNPNIWNASGHWGLYQFSEATWIAHGGSAADFGHASVAEQNAIYAATVAADGYSDWAPYDGC